MSKLGVVEDTLFVPMLGRIYASEHYPQILYDKKALELKKKLPSNLIKQNMQSMHLFCVEYSVDIGSEYVSADTAVFFPTVRSSIPIRIRFIS